MGRDDSANEEAAMMTSMVDITPTINKRDDNVTIGKANHQPSEPVKLLNESKCSKHNSGDDDDSKERHEKGELVQDEGDGEGHIDKQDGFSSEASPLVMMTAAGGDDTETVMSGAAAMAPVRLDRQAPIIHTVRPGAFRITPSRGGRGATTTTTTTTGGDDHDSFHDSFGGQEVQQQDQREQPPLIRTLSANVVDDVHFEEAVQTELRKRTVTASSVDVQSIKTGRRSTTTTDTSFWLQRSVQVSCMILLGLICIIVVGVALGTANETVNNEAGAQIITTTTITPSMTIVTPTETPISTFDLVLEWVAKATSGTDDPSLFADTTSPQYRALEWLVHEDSSGLLHSMTTAEHLQSNETYVTLLKERYVIAVLYFSFGGEDWTTDLEFLTSASVCEWPPISDEEEEDQDVQLGIRCDDKGSVVYIRLDGINVNGTLPSELGTLTWLGRLEASMGGMYGTLPESIGKLSRLKRLNFAAQSLSGTIPETFSNLARLEIFKMTFNELSGTIPSNLFQLPSMEEFQVDYNWLTGMIPELLPATGQMAICELSYNLLSGSLPESIFELDSMLVFTLWSNALTGTIPSRMARSGELWLLGIDYNYMNGTIPSELGSLSNLEAIYMSDNMFSGTIPTEMGQLSCLDQLWMHSNQLSGPVPVELSTISLYEFSIFDNYLTGTLDGFCNRTDSLARIDADCGGDDPLIDCPCCVICCDNPTGNCNANLEAACALDSAWFEAQNSDIDVPRGIPGVAISCECSIGGRGGTNSSNTTTEPYYDAMMINCEDNECQSCNKDGTVCARNEGFTVIMDEGGFWESYSIAFQYVVGRNDTVKFERFYTENFSNQCEVTLNGQICNSCGKFFCADRFYGYSVDCENVLIEGISAGSSNSCDNNIDVTGPLTVFALQDPALLEGCPPRLYL